MKKLVLGIVVLYFATAIPEGEGNTELPSLVRKSVDYTIGRGCLPGLPTFQSYETFSLPGDQLQVIVPSYRFSCSGRVTGWQGCFFPSGSSDRYHVVYQVWREVVPGCYRLVGPGSPLQPPSSDILLQLEGGCNTTVLPAGQQLVVQEGDIVGFYVDYWTMFTAFVLANVNFRQAGIQLLTSEPFGAVEMLYASVAPDELSASYAAGSTAEDVCDEALEEFSGSRLGLTAHGAPVISVLFGEFHGHLVS